MRFAIKCGPQSGHDDRLKKKIWSYSLLPFSMSSPGVIRMWIAEKGVIDEEKKKLRDTSSCLFSIYRKYSSSIST